MRRRAWYWLLVLPFAATLWPPLYNRAEPELFGLPFFYWYQLLWVVLTSGLLALVGLRTGTAMFNEYVIFAVLVIGVMVLGFAAARWGRASMASFDEWALGGRRFGTLVSWFLLGGDLYTAYTFIAVPALMFGAGALGFFAVPYATIAYPIVFLIMARFWIVGKRRGYATAADFVRDRYGSRALEIAVAATCILATLPYIALQLVGMKVIFVELGGPFGTTGGAVAATVAFVILAAYTYTSGLRAPAMIAFVKDALIYVTVIAAIVIIPQRLGGWQHIFAVAAPILQARAKPGSILLSHGDYFLYATWAFGSCLSLFIYPHSITSVLAAKNERVIRRNAALLPAYSLLLGLLALLGICAVAAGVVTKNASLALPLLLARYFPQWFLGVAFAAIVIGALVPAAIMTIGAANLFTSNIVNQFMGRRPNSETTVAKWICLAVCAAALLFVLFAKPTYAIYLQLFGGGWILQTFPAFALGLYTRWFHPVALLAGWAAGMICATWMALAAHFSPAFPLHLPWGGTLLGFNALYALVLNLLVTVVLTFALRAAALPAGVDATRAADYI